MLIIITTTMNPHTLLASIVQHLSHSSSAKYVERVILYGSRVHGKTGPDTDVDLLCIVKSGVTWRERRLVRDWLGKLELRFDLLFDVRFLSIDALTTIEAKQPFVVSAFEEGLSETLVQQPA
jgi:predicted nucleotidyltransferase